MIVGASDPVTAARRDLGAAGAVAVLPAEQRREFSAATSATTWPGRWCGCSSGCCACTSCSSSRCRVSHWRCCSPWDHCSWRCCSSTAPGASSSHGLRSWRTTRSSRSSRCSLRRCCCRWLRSYAAQTAQRAAALLTVDALDMMLMSVLVFLLMRQVMPISAALAGGIALSSFGVVSRAVSWGLQYGTGAARACRVHSRRRPSRHLRVAPACG